MILKSLELHNFRQFMEDEDGHGQKIEFSTDPNKKATLLIAKNATGKTTLLQSFSWVLYGEASGLKSIINVDMKNDMVSDEERRIEGIITLEHLGRNHEISRSAVAKKYNKQLRLGESILKVSYTDEDGNNKELYGSDANSLVNEIVPKDLFPYFFFQGENIEAIGQEISSGKSSGNGKFAKAIRGMLGFNWLYTELTDLKAIIKDYKQEIEAGSKDQKMKTYQAEINNAEAEIERLTSEREMLMASLEALKQSKNEVSEEIIKSGDVAEKQKESVRLGVSIQNAKKDVGTKKKNLFSDFSSFGYRLMAQNLIAETKRFLDEKGGDINKGVPGMEDRAIKYVLDSCLNNGECFCGLKVSELSAECRDRLVNLMKYLPPNNLGERIKTFLNTAEIRYQGGDEFLNEYLSDLEDLRHAEKSLEIDAKRKKEIDDEIKAFPDMEKKKERERQLEKDIERTNQDIGRKDESIKDNQNKLDSAKKAKEAYRPKEERIIKLKEYEKQATMVYDRVKRFCERKEKQKRTQLQAAINDIFKEVFDVDITMKLDDNYNMEFDGNKLQDIADFQNSTSQDAILAFSFIGGIIRLAREKVSGDPSDKSEDEDLENSMEVEPYPLVMDAPSSSFDTDRIKSFCRVMPSIAEQVIFFIKDTDGNHVKKNIAGIIGKEYSMEKTGQYTAVIKEVC